VKKILFIFGTRPEAIKMAPIIKLIEDTPFFESIVCVTAQHREMLDPVLKFFDIKVDHDLNIMSVNQDLFDITSKALLGLKQVLTQESPDMVLIQGDTTTSMAGALAAFYLKIPVGHVEAGLRTGNIHSPFPEEANRAIVSRVAELHFAPTATAKNNLIKENIVEFRIEITGNSVIDALLLAKYKLSGKLDWGETFGSATNAVNSKKPLVLVTAHRRENHGKGFINICQAITELSKNNPEWDFVYPVHFNPNVQIPVKRLLSDIRNIYLIDPLDYAPFVYLMDRAAIILTDSGGIQEEAPTLGKPVLVLRDTTERPEAVKAGTVLLVGTSSERIVEETEKLMNMPEYYKKMSMRHNPYGDGSASEKIMQTLLKYFK
jgi:UDP-N-acetylglucosamine 2-epimerase (non-hydrolysing)